MEHLIKSSAIIFLFYLVYKLLLQRETFFVGNRWFLLTGLIISTIVPFIIIPIYVEAHPLPIEFIVSNQEFKSSTIPIKKSLDFLQLFSWIYIVGLVFFLGKLATEFLSLFQLINQHSSYQVKSFRYVETTNDLAPFSFFKWIIFNPSQFNNDELTLILKHEKIHAKQHHSFDVIFAQLLCTILWFNPFIWIYKKAIQQNLEFIADQATQSNIECEKSYQNLLLKTSITNQNLSLINTFYNSSIKKRIVMLHTSKSKNVNALKYALVLPLLALFIFNFNTKVIAQTKEAQSEKTKIAQNVLTYVITKNTKDKQLESIKEKLLEKKVAITFGELQRNEQHEIVDIKIDYQHNGKSGVFFRKSENPIEDIAILLNVNENELSIGEAKQNLSQSFEIIKEDGETKLKKEENETNIIFYLTDDKTKTDSISVVGKDGNTHEIKTKKKLYMVKSDASKDSDQNEDAIYLKKNIKDTIWIKKDVKNIIWTDDEGDEVEIIAVERGNNNFKIFNNDNEKPLILLNGKEITKEEMTAIEPDSIESVNVLKGDKATAKFGKKAKDGVIEITLKKK